MKLAPKVPLKTFTLVIFVNFLFACLPKCLILLVIVSFHLYCETRHYPRSMKSWNVRISALPGRVLNYQVRGCLRTNVMSNTLACRCRTGWRSRGLALQNVRSFPWLLRTAPSGFLPGTMTWTQLPWRISRSIFPLRVRIMTPLLSPLLCVLQGLTSAWPHHA